MKVFEPAGVLDRIRAGELREKIANCVNDGVQIFLIDFKNVTFTDSSGLGELVRSLKQIRSVGGQLFICSLNEQAKMLFQITSVDRIFDVLPNREAFNQKFPQS